MNQSLQMNNIEEKLIFEKKEDTKLMDLLVKTRYHSLYKRELEEEKLSLNLPVEALNQPSIKGKDGFVQFDALIKPKRTSYVLKFGMFGHNPSDSELNDLIYILESAEPSSELEIHINSPGGYVDELVRFKVIIQTVFRGRTRTVLKNYGASCGALLFCLGDERIITEDSYLMFHNYSNGAWGKGNEIVSSVNFDEKRIDKLFKQIMVNPGYFSEEDYTEMKKGVDYWIDADDMITNYKSLVTHVLVGEYELELEEYLKYKESKLSIEEFVEKEEAEEDESEKVEETTSTETEKKPKLNKRKKKEKDSDETVQSSSSENT